MITVYEWVRHDPEGVGFVEAVYPDDPRVNATCPLEHDPDHSLTREEIKRAYNREVKPDPPIELAGFEFVTPPEGWVNPNDPQ